MSLPGVHNQVKKLHNTITSLEFCISNNTKVSSPIQRYPLHRCWTGISQSLVLAIEIKSIKFNIHFWKKMVEKRAVKQSLTWMADNIKYYSMWKSLTLSITLRNNISKNQKPYSGEPKIYRILSGVWIIIINMGYLFFAKTCHLCIQIFLFINLMKKLRQNFVQ